MMYKLTGLGEGETMKMFVCLILCLPFAHICADSQIATPDEIKFIDSSLQKLAVYADEFGAYISVQRGSCKELMATQLVGSSIAIVRISLTNWQSAHTCGAASVGIPAGNANEAGDFADSLSLGRAVELLFFANGVKTMNFMFFNIEIDNIKRVVPLISNQAIVQTTRDILHLLLELRERLDELTLD